MMIVKRGFDVRQLQATDNHYLIKIVVLANCLLLQLCDYPSCANSKNVVVVKHFVGG